MIDYKSTSAYRFFEEICRIPHGSGNEKALADYVEAFARNKGFYCYHDEFDSVLVRKPASKGREDEKSILLQGHLDMVCEKNADTDFDFLKDGLKLVERDGYIWADGTTLGADDGAAVAIMLSILDDENFDAPEIECLFTTGEETGLIGAINFDYSLIKSRKMINLDTECDGEAIAGSAGGVRCRLTRKIEYAEVAQKTKNYKIKIGGLKGGHSGCDIHLGRISACQTAARLIKLLGDKITLCKINGGNMDNAISRECEIYIKSDDIDAVESVCSDFESTLRAKANEEDKNICIRVTESDNAPEFTQSFSEDLCRLISSVLHGVYAMSRDMEGLVESSSNFASLKEIDGNLVVTVSMRSSVAESLKSMKEKTEEIAGHCGFDVSFESEYPGWQYDPESRMAQIYLESYREVSGREGRVTAIHAGLECGLIKSQIPDIDIISIGPNIYDIHTPNEHMEIESFVRFNDLLRIMVNKQ